MQVVQIDVKLLCACGYRSTFEISKIELAIERSQKLLMINRSGDMMKWRKRADGDALVAD